MSTETIYIPHHSGTVLGGQTARPWLADSAAHALRTVWQGQPVFTSREEAFAWLATARTTMFALVDFAVARLDADVDDRPERTGARRVWLDSTELIDPDRQVVRASSAAAPHPSVLNALYNGAHEEAAHRWTSPPAGWVTGLDPIADLVHTVWSNTYPLAWHDARHVLAERIGQAARLLLADTDPRHDLNAATHRGLAALARTAAAVDDPMTAGVAPAPAPIVLDGARAISADPSRGGWRHAVDRVWDSALTTAAADGVLTAATELTNAWHSRHRSGPPGQTSAGEEAVTTWLRRTLADTTGAVLGQWTHAVGRRPERTTTDQSLDRVSTAGRAYPAMTTVDVALRPADSSSTADRAVAMRTGAVR